MPSSPVTAGLARRATLRRSLSLVSDFRFEQSDPARFYGALARDTAMLIDDLWTGATGTTLDGLTVLDVGGGPGYFADAFADAGAHYVSVEPDASEMHAAGLDARGSVRGSGTALPVRSDSVDICLSSNVAEHVRHPWIMAEEMLRVTRPGGLVVLSYTMWWGPFGGHETGPWHVFGGERAARRYARVHGAEPKNRFGLSLFPIRASHGLRWAAETSGGELLAAFPRYHPRWAWWCVRVPGFRELAVSNLVVVLRAHSAADRGLGTTLAR
ncbi:MULTISPECIES: class I SAM-dependent methyltransferase [unclassified Rhodococcus (in: high G+C Gram-positive bacteria)]|uniref:class I SAM-dependent methyltransferase n=1 Tax=unclassified Rhodococcus (in: high G+C Gram-positive bacteria) TaxID=192944 RepID=UPI0027E20C16|nr:MULTISPECIES: class I SAM-dependent methyltransferase [unclassified Rhodococcus (in: high G+C Gram-positive bacteria)]